MAAQRRRVHFEGAVAHALDGAFGGGRDQPHPFHVHHLQGAVGLVQMGAGQLQAGAAGIAFALERIGDGLARAVEGIADFTDHPGQGAGVEVNCVRWHGRVVGHLERILAASSLRW